MSEPRIRERVLKSKDTYGQTRGLSNLEMKPVSEVASTGVLLRLLKQAGFVPRKVALISQSVGFQFCWLLLHTYCKNIRPE